VGEYAPHKQQGIQSLSPAISDNTAAVRCNGSEIISGPARPSGIKNGPALWDMTIVYCWWKTIETSIGLTTAQTFPSLRIA
jgi:hypothetical protein